MPSSIEQHLRQRISTNKQQHQVSHTPPSSLATAPPKQPATRSSDATLSNLSPLPNLLVEPKTHPLLNAFVMGKSTKQQPAKDALYHTLQSPMTAPIPLIQVKANDVFAAVRHCWRPTSIQEWSYFALHAGQGALRSIKYSFYPYFHTAWARYGLLAVDLISRNYQDLLQTAQLFYYQKQDIKIQQIYLQQFSGATHLAGIASEQNKVAELLQQTTLLHKHHTQIWGQLLFNCGTMLITLIRIGLHWRSAFTIMFPLHCGSLLLQFLIKQRWLQPIQRHLNSFEIEQNNNLRRSPLIQSQGSVIDFQRWWQQQQHIRERIARLLWAQQSTQWFNTMLQATVHVVNWYVMGWLTPKELTNELRSQAMSLSLASTQLIDMLMLLPNFWQERRHVLLQLQTRSTELAVMHSCTFPQHIQLNQLTFTFNQQTIDYPTLVGLIDSGQTGLVQLQAANGSGKTMLIAQLQQAFATTSLMLPAYCYMITGDDSGANLSSGQRTLQRLQEVFRQLEHEPQMAQVCLLLLDEVRANLSLEPREWLDEQLQRLSQTHLIIEIDHTAPTDAMAISS